MKLLVVRCILSASSPSSFTASFKLRGLQEKDSIKPSVAVRGSESSIETSSDLWLVKMYPYSSFPPVPSSGRSFRLCRVSAARVG